MPATSVLEIMEFVVMPTAQRLWDSVAVNVTEQGIIEKAPKTDEDWAEVRGDALTLAEMANALMIPGRMTAPPGTKSENPGDELEPEQIEALREQNWGAWVAHAQVLHAAVMESVKAIDAKDKDALSNAGGTLDEACESCHLQFWYPPKPEDKN
jgi:cytochrome c556